MNDPWGSSSTAAWASPATTTPFPSLPTPAILSLRERQPSPLHLAPPDAARLGGARPITLAHSLPSSQAQTPWAEDFADDPLGTANGWAVGTAAGEGGLAAAVWAGSSTVLRSRRSTRTSLSLSFNMNSHSPVRGASPKLPALPGREPSPDLWTKGSPVVSEGGWGDLASPKERRYTLKRFVDDDFFDGRPWARDNSEVMSQISLGACSASVTDAEDKDKHAISQSIAEEEEEEEEEAHAAGVGQDKFEEAQNMVVVTDGQPRKGYLSTTHSDSRADKMKEPEPEPLQERSLTPGQPTAEVLSEGREAPVAIGSSCSPAQPPPKPRRRVSTPYPVNLGLLDHLFPDTTAPQARPAELPAHDTRDSLGTIDESKAWYRVSRFGSMRKHDRGEDDEKYTRVSWQGSAVQGEVEKIVRRWLEEASNGRQSVLFGGGRGGGIFNWDTKETPLSLDKIFPKKSAVSFTSSRGLAESEFPPARFSWSADSNTTAIASPTPGRRPKSTNPTYAPSCWSISAPRARPAHSSARERVQTHPAPNIVPQSKQSRQSKQEDADEDEWGEMVSTPAATTNSHFVDSGFGSWATTPVTDAGRRSEDKAASLSSRRASLSHHEPSVPASAKSSASGSTDMVTTTSSQRVSAPASHVPTTEVRASPPRKHVGISPAPVSIPSPGTLTGTTAGSAADHAETDMHADHGGVVRRIVDGLPDLSYILR